MTRIVFALSLVVSPALAEAQAAPARTTKGLEVVTAAAANAPPRVPDGGGAPSETQIAQQQLSDARLACPIVEKDGKLFAACDNSTERARLAGKTYVPQTAIEWEFFARRVANADKVLIGRRRPLVVLNRGEVVAEVTAAGMVQVKKFAKSP